MAVHRVRGTSINPKANWMRSDHRAPRGVMPNRVTMPTWASHSPDASAMTNWDTRFLMADKTSIGPSGQSQRLHGYPVRVTSARHSKRGSRRLFRRLRHLHRPDCRWTHIHGSSVMAALVPGFGCAEPVSLGFIGGVIDAPCGAESFIFQAVAQH